MIRDLKIAQSKWLIISDGEILLVHMELTLFSIYKGVATGCHHNHKGAASHLMSLPLNGTHYLNTQPGQYRSYAVEYCVYGIHNHANCHNIPCALYETIGTAHVVGIKNTMVTLWLDVIVKKETTCITALINL